jgi:hypothetical protein
LPHTDRWDYFAALGIQHLSKVIPNFEAIPSTTVYSGLLRADARLSGKDQLNFVGTGQVVKNSNLTASPLISPSATLLGNDRFEVLQGHWTHWRNPETIWQLGFGFSHTSPTDTFLHGTNEPNRTQLFTGEMTGAAPVESDSARSRFSLLGQGQSRRHVLSDNWNHLLYFGFELDKSLATEARRVFEDVGLLFFPADVPAQVIQYNTPVLPKYRLREFSLFFDDHFQFSDRIFFRFGLTLDSSHGFLPAQRSAAGTYAPERDLPGVSDLLSWTSLDPRAGLTIPVFKRFGGGTFLSASFARYHHPLSMQYLSYANPTSLAGQVFGWNDRNNDQIFQPGEEGPLLRVFGGPYSSIDPKLQRPRTEEWVLGLDHSFSSSVQASLRLFHHKAKRLVESVNVGVPQSAFTPIPILDIGDDNVRGTRDDQILTVFNQEPSTLGQDRYLLTNPLGFSSIHKGLEVALRRKLVEPWFISVSFSAYKGVGPSSPGNSEFENDNGVIGRLYDDPNALLNASGRLFFDRAFVGKIAVFGRAPFGFYLGTVAKYSDGLPFGRRLIISGLNQGPFFVMATPRGQPGGLRTQFNVIFDQRIGRDFELGRSKLSFLIDIFNVLNLNNSLREFDISGPLFPQRRPLDVQNPRVVRLGIRWNF